MQGLASIVVLLGHCVECFDMAQPNRSIKSHACQDLAMVTKHCLYTGWHHGLALSDWCVGMRKIWKGNVFGVLMLCGWVCGGCRGGTKALNS